MIKFQFPVNFIYISQPFKKSSHLGIDLGFSSKGICGGKNQPVYAPQDGTIEKVVSNYQKQDKTGTSYGNYIIINHGNGFKTRVAHLKYGSISVKAKDKVTRGQQLAKMGNTGRTSGNHTHYEVIKNGKVVNPLDYTYYTDKQTIADVTKKAYSLKKYVEDVKPTPTPTPTPTYVFKKGDKVQIIGKGNSQADGKGKSAGGIGYKRTIKKIHDGKKYPYQVGNLLGTTGFYQEKALKKI